jgi:hypothetical protein
MRLTALPILVALCSGCARGPADTFDCYASEAARDDFICSGPENTAEVQEPQIVNVLLALTCAFGMYIVVHKFCEEGDFFTNVCPPGDSVTITDTLDKTKKVRISCDTIKVLSCGTAEVAGDAALVKLRGHIL